MSTTLDVVVRANPPLEREIAERLGRSGQAVVQYVDGVCVVFSAEKLRRMLAEALASPMGAAAVLVQTSDREKAQ